MTSSVRPLRAVYKTSCWPSYWWPAHEALTFNWPSIYFEGHPPVTGAHKCAGVKPTCTWAELLCSQCCYSACSKEGTYFSLACKTLIFKRTPHLTHNQFQVSIFQISSIIAAKPETSELPMATIKEKVSRGNSLIIGFGSLLGSQVLLVTDVLVWGIVCFFCHTWGLES